MLKREIIYLQNLSFLIGYFGKKHSVNSKLGVLTYYKNPLEIKDFFDFFNISGQQSVLFAHKEQGSGKHCMCDVKMNLFSPKSDVVSLIWLRSECRYRYKKRQSTCRQWHNACFSTRQNQMKTLPEYSISISPTRHAYFFRLVLFRHVLLLWLLFHGSVSGSGSASGWKSNKWKPVGGYSCRPYQYPHIRTVNSIRTKWLNFSTLV